MNTGDPKGKSSNGARIPSLFADPSAESAELAPEEAGEAKQAEEETLSDLRPQPGRFARRLARRLKEKVRERAQGPRPSAPAPVPETESKNTEDSTWTLDPNSPAAKKRRSSSRDISTTDSGADPATPTSSPLPTISSTAELARLEHIPRYLLPADRQAQEVEGRLSCAYCGVGDSGATGSQSGGQVTERSPTAGCAKLSESTGLRGTLYPVHTAPSIKDRYAHSRRSVSYEDGVGRLADLLLDHRDPDTQILVYGCGQIDYFTVFAIQEVFRLLGVRNIAGNAEHCLNAGGVHNEMLTGQEGPFLTFDGAFEGPGRFFLMNGWNGLTTHPGAWKRLLERPDFDGYIVDVMETESAAAVRERLGADRVLLIRSGSDAHLALGVAHELLLSHPEAISERFLDRFADDQAWAQFEAFARDPRWEASAVAERIAPEPSLTARIQDGIVGIAAKLAEPSCVPIHIPSVGLSQTRGAVPHCLWGNAMAMLGKYGLAPAGAVAGGTLRIPGQINAQSEIQGLSRLFFFGRVPVDDPGAAEACRRVGLPEDSYELAVRDDPRPVLDYSVSDNRFDRELIIAFGTQFEANMMDRQRWLEKLARPGVTLVVVDPIPDPFSLQHAHLILPSPPHAAAPKLYQNGEWRLTLSVPDRKAPEQTRSDPTIVYDAMAEISRRIRTDSMLRMIHPDLGFHSQTGYLRQRFERADTGGGLPRIDGEVSRAHLWERVLDYLRDGDDRPGPLYCLPTHPDGREIEWSELLEAGHIIYGGVGTHRFMLDYDDPGCTPFADLYGRPGSFRFFTPQEGDLLLPVGTVLNSGRSPLSDDPLALRYATGTFNSGKATSSRDMPHEHPLFISPSVASAHKLKSGDPVRIRNRETGQSLTMRTRVSDRLVGDLVYVPFNKDRMQARGERYLNRITSQTGRCPYTQQTSLKATEVSLEAAEHP